MTTRRFLKQQLNVGIATSLLHRLDKLGEPFGVMRPEMVRRAIEEFVIYHAPTPLTGPAPAAPAKPAKRSTRRR